MSAQTPGWRFGRLPQRIRTAGRVLVIPFVIVVFAMNVAGGPSHGSITRAPASDAEIIAFVADQVRDTGIPGAALAIVRDGRVSTTAAFGTADSTRPRDDRRHPVRRSARCRSRSRRRPSCSSSTRARSRWMRRSSAICRTSRWRRRRLPQPITVRQLLDPDERLAAGRRRATAQRAASPISASQVGALADVAPATAPGIAYAYSNANYLVLGPPRGDGSPASPTARYVEDHVFAPLGDDPRHRRSQPTEVANGSEPSAPAVVRSATRGPRRSIRPDLEPGRLPHGKRLATLDDSSPRRWMAERSTVGGSSRPRATAEMQRGVAPMGLGDPGRYGLGWADGQTRRRPDGRPRREHDGHGLGRLLLARAAVRRRLLLNGQSTLYELAHKPDLIGMAAFALLAGREPDGTIGSCTRRSMWSRVLLLGWIAWRLVRAGAADASRRVGRAPPASATAGSASPWRSGWTRSSRSSCSPRAEPARRAVDEPGPHRSRAGAFAFALLRAADRPRAGHRRRSGDPDPLVCSTGRQPRHRRIGCTRCARCGRPRLDAPSPRSCRTGARGCGGGGSHCWSRSGSGA